MNKIKKYEKYANWLIVGGLVILGSSTLLFLFKTTVLNFGLEIDSNIFDHFGSFIGGLLGAFFSLAGVYLLILNLKSQEIDIQKQQIENRFFELIKIHRENCNEIKVQDKEGREVFKWLQKEFYKCYEIAKSVSDKSENKFSEREIINIAYISFFFGAVGEYSSKTVKSNLASVEEKDSSFLKELLTEFENQKEPLKQKGNFPYKLFDGHQFRLGHYYRHLYQTVKYINEQPNHILNYEAKYQYIKTLRAQLSTQEQVLLFFNSLSKLGKNWEMDNLLTENGKLITKYNFIKNIPEGYVSYFALKNYFPDVKYEGQEENTDSKKEKIKQYR